jgi:putative inorganic carbon (hco3(-)) transporter
MSESTFGTRARGRLPDPGALLVAGLALAAFSVTTSWMGLAVEWATLAVLFYLRPMLGLYLVVLSIPFAFAIRRAGGAAVSANDLLLFAAVAAWTLRRALAWRSLNGACQSGSWRKQFGRIDWAIAFLLLVCLASVLVGDDKRSALWELRVLALQPALLYLLVRTAPLSKVGLLRMGDALVLGAATLALIGLYQFFVLHYVEATEGVRRLLIPFYDSPNHISLFLGRAAPVALALAVCGCGPLRRALHGLALAAMLLAIYLTYSRGAWLVGLPAALLFVLLLPQLAGSRNRRRALLIAAGALALGLLALLPVARTARFASLAQPGSGTAFLRLVLWKGALRMIAAHPLIGVGIGNFAAQYPRYMLPEAWREPLVYHPHNILLDFWAILGLPGLAALAWLQIAFWRSGLALYRRLADPALRALMLGLMGSMVSFLAHGLVDTAFFLADLALVFMLTLALTQRLETIIETSSLPRSKAPQAPSPAETGRWC